MCQLGKWIYGDGQKFIHLQGMKKLEQLHAEFHATIGRVIDAKNITDIDLAIQEKDKVYALSQKILTVLDEVNEELYESTRSTSSKPKPSIIKNQTQLMEKLKPKTATPKPALSQASKPIQDDDNWSEF